MTDASRTWSDDMPSAYERWLVPVLFTPFARDLAARVAALRPARVLELAAGTGAVTRELVEALPETVITASDLNQPMVDVGRDRVPRAEWRQADAMQLPFDDAAFDVVTCQFGVMFFPDRVAAYAECLRVLRGNGTFVFNAWGPIEQQGFAEALMRVLEETLGHKPPSFLSEIPYGYSDTAQITADLTAAGFSDVRIEEVTLTGRSDSARDVTRGFCLGSPLRAPLAELGDVEAFADDAGQRLTTMLGDGPVVADMMAVVVEATP